MFLCFFSSSAELKVGVTPGTSYAMEYSSLQITCTAYDDANEEMPQSIQFIEIDDYSNKKNLTDKDSNLNFTTTQEGKKSRKVCQLWLNWENSQQRCLIYHMKTIQPKVTKKNRVSYFSVTLELEI